jgi:hypothetical protein
MKLAFHSPLLWQRLASKSGIEVIINSVILFSKLHTNLFESFTFIIKSLTAKSLFFHVTTPNA